MKHVLAGALDYIKKMEQQLADQAKSNDTSVVPTLHRSHNFAENGVHSVGSTGSAAPPVFWTQLILCSCSYNSKIHSVDVFFLLVVLHIFLKF